MEGEQFNIEQIYDLYYRDVYHFALYYTNNRQEAEDITHLRGLKEFSVKETAEIIGCSERKVRVDYHMGAMVIMMSSVGAFKSALGLTFAYQVSAVIFVLGVLLILPLILDSKIISR